MNYSFCVLSIRNLFLCNKFLLELRGEVRPSVRRDLVLHSRFICQCTTLHSVHCNVLPIPTCRSEESHNCGRIWRACRVVPHARRALARLTPAAGAPFKKGGQATQWGHSGMSAIKKEGGPLNGAMSGPRPPNVS